MTSELFVEQEEALAAAGDLASDAGELVLDVAPDVVKGQREARAEKLHGSENRHRLISRHLSTCHLHAPHRLCP